MEGYKINIYMKISLVIPAHNEEKYIVDCLKSVQEHGKDLFEVIVVDNASTDKTSQVAVSFPGVKVVSEPNKGISYARQRGFLESSGDIIANVDADNRLPKGWVKKIQKEFSKNDNLVALSGPYQFYDLPRFMRFEVQLFYLLGYLTYLFNHFILRKSGMLQGGNYIIRRSALEKIGGYDTSLNFYGEDTDMARRLSKCGLIKFTFFMPIYSSGRRLRKEGILNAGAKYALNYFWILMFKRPFHQQDAEVIRD